MGKEIKTYDELFKALSKRTGKSPEEFKKALEKAALKPSAITPKCLDMEEVNELPRLENRTRIAHVVECEFCSLLVGASVDEQKIKETGTELHPLEFGHFHFIGQIKGQWIINGRIVFGYWEGQIRWTSIAL